MKWIIEPEKTEIQVLPDLAAVSRAAAKCFAELARERAAQNGNSFTVALAGGSTPKDLYRLLADERERFRAHIDWQKINFFWGDERCVAPDSEESNFRMANENLLQPLGISPTQIHRFQSELEASAAAENYEQILHSFFNLKPNEFPRFDLILLGMGADGHTASIFPNSEVLRETKKSVAAPFVEKFATHRLTLTPPVINHAANVVFLVAGADKAEILREVLQGDFAPEIRPSQIIRLLNGKLTWLVDEQAAQRLNQPNSAQS